MTIYGNVHSVPDMTMVQKPVGEKQQEMLHLNVMSRAGMYVLTSNTEENIRHLQNEIDHGLRAVKESIRLAEESLYAKLKITQSSKLDNENALSSGKFSDQEAVAVSVPGTGLQVSLKPGILVDTFAKLKALFGTKEKTLAGVQATFDIFKGHAKDIENKDYNKDELAWSLRKNINILECLDGFNVALKEHGEGALGKTIMERTANVVLAMYDPRHFLTEKEIFAKYAIMMKYIQDSSAKCQKNAKVSSLFGDDVPDNIFYNPFLKATLSPFNFIKQHDAALLYEDIYAIKSAIKSMIMELENKNYEDTYNIIYEATHALECMRDFGSEIISFTSPPTQITDTGNTWCFN